MSLNRHKCVGILTSGGDCPGLNSAIRGIIKAAIGVYDMSVVGVQDGFRGLIENRFVDLDKNSASGILTLGGTILGTSRTKIHKVKIGEKVIDMTDVAVENIARRHIDCLVCLGGGGTQKNAMNLANAGINVVTLPKTIDNDVWGTDISFGYDTARQIATEAMDRLHTTATSHHRIIVCEIMGHRAGWLALTSGIAAGADVILIPEIPYDLDIIAAYIKRRQKRGNKFSIIAVAEGAVNRQSSEAKKNGDLNKKKSSTKKKVFESLDDIENLDFDDQLVQQRIDGEVRSYHIVHEPIASMIARSLQELTGMEARVTTLGHVQRGGIPSAFDRTLCTLLSTTAASFLSENKYNVMVGYNNNQCVAVPLEEVAGKKKLVPQEHPLVKSARLVGTCFGDE
jgi:ATP-dependent phosphofructokinase / diphosphate-dependent phosphofructokinase